MNSSVRPPRYHARLGDPVFDFGRTQVLAYWNGDRKFTEPRFNFHTRSQLLGDDEDSIRVLNVEWSDVCWCAGPLVLQKDFAESPFFFMHPLQGPEARLGAIRLLLEDQAFRQFFSDSMESLEGYECHAARKAREGWF